MWPSNNCTLYSVLSMLKARDKSAYGS